MRSGWKIREDRRMRRKNRIWNKHKRTKLFWHSLFSYVCVLLLPILVCSVYYYHSYRVLQDHIRENQHLVLENVGGQIDSVFKDVYNLGSHLQLNRYVIALSNRKTTLNSSPFLDRHYLKGSLGPLQVSNALIHRINIYFPESGYIVSSTSSYEKTMIPYMPPGANMLSSEDWDLILERLKSARFICYSGTDSNFLTIAQPLLTASDGEILSMLSVQIDKRSLRKILESHLVSAYPCAFALVDESGILLDSGDPQISLPAEFLPDIYSFFEEGQDRFFEIEDSEKLLVDLSELLVPKTAILFIAQKSGFQHQMCHIVEMMFLTLSICVLLGIIIIMYLSGKNYEPVSQIMRYIQRNGEEREAGDDEYRFIMKVLDKNHNEISRQQEMIRNNYLQKIFTGEIPLSQIPEAVAKQLAISLPTDSICMVLLSVENVEEQGEISQQTSFIIRNVYQELLGEIFEDTYFSIRMRQITVLVSVPDGSASPVQQIRSRTDRLISFLEDSFQISLRAGISGIQDREHIFDAYLQADMALQYEKFFEEGVLRDHDSIPRKQTIGSLPLNTSDYVINLVTQRQRSQLKEYFDTLQKELKHKKLSWIDARSCYYFFYQVTAKLHLYCQSNYGICPEEPGGVRRKSSLPFRYRGCWKRPAIPIWESVTKLNGRGF